MVIPVAEPSLVMLIGPSGSGKSTFARRHFRATEVLSSDFCRALVCDDESNQSATNDAFELLHILLGKRLEWRRTTVIDATNVQLSSRESLALAAKTRNIALIAIVFALPEEICQARNRQRPDRQVPSDIIREQIATLHQTIDNLHSEGFQSVFTLRSPDEAATVSIIRHPAVV